MVTGMSICCLRSTDLLDSKLLVGLDFDFSCFLIGLLPDESDHFVHLVDDFIVVERPGRHGCGVRFMERLKRVQWRCESIVIRE